MIALEMGQLKSCKFPVQFPTLSDKQSVTRAHIRCPFRARLGHKLKQEKFRNVAILDFVLI